MADKPEKEFRAGSCRAVIWQNEREKDGNKFTVPSVQVTRRYKDSNDGAWKETNSFRKEELAYLLLVVRAALDYLALKTRDPAAEGNQPENEQ